MPARMRVAAHFLVLSFVCSVAHSETIINKHLPYPSGTPTADQIAEQVFFVNQFHGFNRYAITKKGKTITVLINQAQGKRPTSITVERFKKNDFANPAIRSKEIAIFRSGKLRGTGMLIVDFEDDSKSQSYSIWLPALRKIRRFGEPALDDAWGGTDFTFGDVILRKPFHDTHELLGTETFNDCLGIIENVKNKWLPNPPPVSCEAKGKEVYKLKSTSTFKNWWYDYRVSYVDTKTFADYRTEYFKDGKQVKVIDRDWRPLGTEDPRQISWGYWYGKNLETGHETWAVIPKEIVIFGDQVKKSDSFWSEKSLRKIKR